MLFALGAAAAAGHASAVTVACAGQPGSKHSSPHGSKAGAQPMTTHAHAQVARHDAVRATVAECIAAGEACLAHCLERLGAGDTSLAECSKAVTDMLAICRAFGPLAAANSPLLPKLAAVCVTACERCEAACEPHVDHHPECRTCRDACRRTLEAVRPLAI